MSDITLDWIWSEYTTSPDCAAGMQCLQQTCSALYKHVLLPTHLVLSGGGFLLHPDLAQLLTNVVPPLGRLLDLALRSAGLPGAQSFCQTELHVLTCTTGLEIATQNQVVWNWIHLIDKVYVAMVDLKSLRYGRPLYILGCKRPSRMRETLASLPLPLLVKLPADFLKSYGISIAKARDAVYRMAQVHERGSTGSRSHSRPPQSDSHTRQDCAEAGGLVSSRTSTVVHAAGAANSVSPSRIDTAAVDTLLTPSLPCMSAAAPVTPPHGREASSVELRGISAKPTNGLDHLAFEYRAGADSVCQRATDIASQSALRREDIVDRGEYTFSGSPHLGRFGLEANLFIRVGEVVTAMQSLLTRVSSVSGRQACFIVDPNRTLIGTLRGAGGVAELHCAWDGLIERLGIAQSIFDLYQQGCTDPEREACDAAARRRVMQWAREDVALPARRTPGAQKHRGPPDVAQSATGGVILPATSPPPVVVRAPTPAGLPHLSSHLMEDGIGMGECTGASGHAPVAATPAAVKDPPLQFACASSLAAEHRSMALVAKNGEAAEKPGGLEKDLHGRAKYSADGSHDTTLTSSLSKRSLAKPFGAAAIRFPAPAHVLEDVVVELGGLDTEETKRAIDPRELEDAVTASNQQRIVLREDAPTVDTNNPGVHGASAQTSAPAVTRQTLTPGVTRSVADWTHIRTSRTVKAEGQGPAVRSKSRSRDDGTEYAPANAVSRLSPTPTAAENRSMDGGGRNEGLRERAEYAACPRGNRLLTLRKFPAHLSDNLGASLEESVKKPLFSTPVSGGRCGGILPKGRYVSDPFNRFEAMASSASVTSRSSGSPGASVPLAAPASTTIAVRTAASDRLQELVPPLSRSIETEDELGGQLGLRREKKSIFSEQYSVLLLPPAIVLAVGACTVERGGPKDVASRANQRHFHEYREELTLHMLAYFPIAVRPVSALLPSLSILLSVLSVTPHIKASALVSAVEWTYKISYLGLLVVGSSEPNVVWAREGIGTRPENEFHRRGRATTH